MSEGVGARVSEPRELEPRVYVRVFDHRTAFGGHLPAGPLRTLCALAIWLVAMGCAPWSQRDEEPARLPAPRVSPDAVNVAVLFLTIDKLSIGVEPEVWRQADEQRTPVEVRRRLEANGLRCGVLGQLPDVVSELYANSQNKLPWHDPEKSIVAGEEVIAQQPTTCWMWLNQGRRYEILAPLGVREQAEIVIAGDREVSRQAAERVQSSIALRAFAQDDGRARIEVTPEIAHGETRNRWVGDADEGVWRLSSQQERLVLDELRTTALLAPGEILVIGCSESPAGIGALMLATEAGVPRNLLLIRLARTPHDAVFGP